MFEELEKLKNLEYLTLKACMGLKKVVVKNRNLIRLNLRNCPNITELNLSECNFLSELNLFGTTLKDWDLITAIQSVAKQLKYLELRSAKNLTFYDEEMLINCKNLTSLNLGKTQVTDSFVKTISFEKLYLIDLSWCPNLKDLEFKNMKNLLYLFFDNSVNLESLKIENCPKMIRLNITNTKIKNVEKITEINNIKDLELIQ